MQSIAALRRRLSDARFEFRDEQEFGEPHDPFGLCYANRWETFECTDLAEWYRGAYAAWETRVEELRKEVHRLERLLRESIAERKGLKKMRRMSPCLFASPYDG
jgi:hypothetical protein